MHLTRAEVNRKIPIERKGTKYVVRTLSHVNDSVSVLIALRDMLHLAQTAREVNEMIKDKLVKINGRVVRDCRQPIHILNLFEADKKYKLIILPTGRFALEETKDNMRIAKVIGKKMLNNNSLQLNLHDGTNLATKEKANIGDSVELDVSNKIHKIINLEKGKKVLVESGRSIGMIGIIKGLEGKKVNVQLGERSTLLMRDHLIAI